MIRCLTVSLAAILPLPAVALSCMPHSMEARYKQIAEAKEASVVVLGTLTFDAKLLPETDWDNQQKTPPQTNIPARIDGSALAKSGFNVSFQRDVVLSVLCYGPWCASAVSGGQMLAFVQKSPEGYVVSTNPCGGDVFTAPSPDMIRKVQQCFNGEDCSPADR